MNVLLIGATGTIGSKLYEALREEHTVFPASRNSKEFPIDITKPDSVLQALQALPLLDAIINMAGHATWKPFNELTEEDFYTGIRSKLMGQVNLIRLAKDHLEPKGSITLTTGILADFYEPGAAGLALVNGGIHSFVQAAAPELDNGLRLNVVAPGALEGTIVEGKLFAQHRPVSFESVIDVYKRALFGTETGQVFKIY
ncbi:MAG: short chain dehydrogenase [Bacteroidota bacterium]